MASQLMNRISTTVLTAALLSGICTVQVKAMVLRETLSPQNDQDGAAVQTLEELVKNKQ